MSVDIPMRFMDSPLLWSLEDVYSPEECAAFISRIESSAPVLATNNALYRDQDRVINDDTAVAAELFQRISSKLPTQMGSLRLVGLNERLRMYRYRPGQRFAPHTDHWYQPSSRRISLHSVLAYFNDDFEGGETRFQEQLEETVTPKRGLVVVFQHKVRHEGCPVLSGTKYAMRTDVIYEADDDIGTTGGT